VVVHDAPTPEAALEGLLAEGAEAVVLAGRNDRKMATVARLVEAGIHVLADKPWVTGPSALPDLERATAADAPALAADIMTVRHDALARVGSLIVADRELFGSFCSEGDTPAIELGLVHHLVKTVNGVTLERPPWYYDVRVQGDGLVDVHSHMADRAQWLVGAVVEPQRPFDPEGDVVLESAIRWETPVPLELYRESTGRDDFARDVQPLVEGGVLPLACNGEIRYRLRGVPVLARSEWRPREPEGGGDLHHIVVRGERLEMRVRQGPQTGYRAELHVRPRDGDPGTALEAAASRWEEEFPGVRLAPSDLGLEVLIPPALRPGHEAQFALVLEDFLDWLDAGRLPPGLPARLRTRYTLLGRAKALADEG
jgi:predicted dehydrogenase